MNAQPQQDSFASDLARAAFLIVPAILVTMVNWETLIGSTSGMLATAFDELIWRATHGAL